MPDVRDRDKSEDQRAITVERVRDKSNTRCERYVETKVRIRGK